MSHKTFLLTRASGPEMNAAQFGNLSTMFASTAASKSTFTLLVTKEDGAIRDYLHLDETAVPGNAHLTLGNALGASPEPAQLPDHIDQATVLGHATFDSAATSRDTQYGAENADFARAMAPVIGEGEWVAVTARAASKKEGAHHLKWLSHRMGTARPTHHSLSTNPLVVTIRAGADNAERVEHLLNAVTSAAPGFDLVIKATVEKKFHPAWKALPVGVAAIAAAIALVFNDQAMAGAGLLVLGLLAVMLGIGSLTHKIPSPSTTLARRIERGEFPDPPKRSGKAKAPHEAYTKKIKGRDDQPDKEIRVDAFDGDYPVHPDTFYVGPSVHQSPGPRTATSASSLRRPGQAKPDERDQRDHDVLVHRRPRGGASDRMLGVGHRHPAPPDQARRRAARRVRQIDERPTGLLPAPTTNEVVAPYVLWPRRSCHGRCARRDFAQPGHRAARGRAGRCREPYLDGTCWALGRALRLQTAGPQAQGHPLNSDRSNAVPETGRLWRAVRTHEVHDNDD